MIYIKFINYIVNSSQSNRNRRHRKIKTSKGIISHQGLKIFPIINKVSTRYWYHWLSTGLTTGSIFCRRSRAWVKRFTRENYVIKMEDLKNLAAETSGMTTIFPIQMTINNKVTNFWWQGSRWNIFQTASCYVILVFHFNPHCGDRIWTSKLVIGLNRDWAFREVSEH